VMVAPLSDIQANRNSLILAIVAILAFLTCIFLLAVRFVT
jgi:hypothetical protein